MAAFDITVDNEHVKKYNEYFKDARRLVASALVLCILAFLGAVLIFVFAGTGAWQYTVMAVLAVLMVSCIIAMIAVPKQVGDAQQLYDYWPLVPAVVAEVNPRDITVLALVNLASDPQQEPRLALTVRAATNLPGIPRKVGARVPAIAVGGQHSSKSQYWDEVTPVPVCWATADKATQRNAEKAIANKRWALLEDNIDKAEQTRLSSNRLYPLA
ncbi:DUF3239 domain-containing protein [Corynebacterium sp. TAE3-ERU12]|uniref:DUF3239 domain-containing protein n=1 Tax=Corynebacterium sp. TAE3-ERU12 TaxID=2849491 RepID=UPI001C476B86|nr:DUF3239 domain-containing protein [Corynebacterium sp. TAE3-ERU12]MBV7295536.1 DUF3239 domain-containing protein [Corynebacterium sp. TAE3-ERU12]